MDVVMNATWGIVALFMGKYVELEAVAFKLHLIKTKKSYFAGLLISF